MSYMATHNKIRRVRGNARQFACVDCGEQAQEWALMNGAPGEVQDEQGRRYSRNLADYSPMCFRCHRLYDKSSITHCPKGHPYEGDNVLMDAGKRKCRTCVYARKRGRKLTPEQRARASERQRQRRAEAAA